ncbi:hypothetical protein BDN72DRAFT_900005 [Pluteus cervinus]|uniref:Uncharacterized protein n=1 Tax=Pluteus cervinus TaxID=181527 RepID=A0ACD3AL87_9AGAR|nr:hypothetical protein BDN72DRAFT_900005 [Pluteus cervinus]
MTRLWVSISAWRGVNATVHLIAIFATIFRLHHRYRLRRLWWDDYWAGIALLFSFGYFATVWMRRDVGDPSLGRKEAVALFWMTTTFFPCEVWSARMSLAFSIIRLIPERAIFRRRCMYALATIFGMMWLALILEKLWVCASDSSWTHTVAVQCLLGNAVGIITLCTDVISDTCLIIIPLFMLREVRIPVGQRRLLLAIFCSSIFSSLAGVIYAIFVFRADNLGVKRGLLISLTANIKAAVTLLVCNMLVIVTYFYRTFRRGQDLETDHTPVEPSKPAPVPASGGNHYTTTTDMSSVPTFETTSTFDTSPRSAPTNPTMTSSKFVNTAGTPLPTITETDTPSPSVATASVIVDSRPHFTKSAPA